MKFEFIHNDLGQRNKGEIVEVTLTMAANVQLMDSSNFANYRNGRDYRYIGGLAKQSPFYLSIPSPGRWHVAIDTRGLANGTRASVRILPAPLPEAKGISLSSIPSLVRQDVSPPYTTNRDTYDVFISHASEDKDGIVRELAEALREERLRGWYDEFTLQIGDSLRRKIDQGLANSRVGIVILSPAFMKKGWTNYELDGLVTRSVSGEQILLPIWHNVTKQQVIDYSPSLADKVARSTATHTPAEIAREIADLLRSFVR